MHSSISFSGYARRKIQKYHTRRLLHVSDEKMIDRTNNPSHTAIITFGLGTYARWNGLRRTWTSICMVTNLGNPGLVTNRRSVGLSHIPHVTKMLFVVSSAEYFRYDTLLQ